MKYINRTIWSPWNVSFIKGGGLGIITWVVRSTLDGSDDQLFNPSHPFWFGFELQFHFDFDTCFPVQFDVEKELMPIHMNHKTQSPFGAILRVGYIWSCIHVGSLDCPNPSKLLIEAQFISAIFLLKIVPS